MLKTAAAAILALAFIGLLAPFVHAQDIELDSIVVEGRILRPQAAYIIQRASVEFGIDAKKRSFVHKIEASVDEEPFVQ